MPRAKTKAQLQRELEQAKLSAEIAQHRLSQNLSESFNQFPNADLINPWGQLFDGQQLIFPLFPSRYNDPGIVQSEAQLDLIRWYSRWLYWTNPTAKGIIRGLENYVVKTGYEYTITAKKNASDKYVKEVQTLVDEFLETNNWFERELDLFRRSRRDGEFFVRLFAQDDGPTLVRSIDPQQVRSPDQSAEWRFGVHTDPDDAENVLGYNVSYDGTTNEEVPAAEIVHMKINADLINRRGVSDFFSTMEALQGVNKLLRSSVMGESVRQAIAYVRQFQQANKSTVQSLQSANTDYTETVPTFSGTSRQVPVRQVVPGSVDDIPEGLEYLAGPQGNGANAVAILQQAFQVLAAFWQMPVWMVSGDTGQTNFAASLVAESPFVRGCEVNQKLYSNKYKEIVTRVIDIAVTQGRLPDDVLDEIQITVHCAPVVVRNAKEETDRSLILSNAGLLSDRTWSDREELDPDVEKENKKLDGDLDKPRFAAAKLSVSDTESTSPNAQYAKQTNRPE